MSQRYNTSEQPKNTLTESVTDKLRRTLLANQIPNTKISGILGISRQTVSNRFRTKSLSLDDFFSIAALAGINPAKLIEEVSQDAAAD